MESPEAGRVPTSEPQLWVPDGAGFELLQDQRLVIPVVGAGVSQQNGMPGASGLRDALMNNFEPHPRIGEFSEGANLMLVADQIVDDDPLIKPGVLEFVADFFDQALASCEPNQVVRDLVQVPSKLIITFNYDGLLQAAADREDIECSTYDSIYDFQAFNNLARAPGPPDKLTILHLHGSALNHPHIILDSSGYRLLSGHSVAERMIEGLLTSRRLCYMGTRLNEPHVMTMLLQGMADTRMIHPIFLPRGEAAEFRARITEGRRYGFKVCVLPSQAHIAGLARHLRRKPSDPDGGIGVLLPDDGPMAPSPTPDYVRNHLAEWNDNRDERTLDYLAIFEDANRNEGEASQVLDERSIASGSRDLIVGPPGSGKTELLKYSARLVPATRQPILLRLTDVPLAKAEPSVLLRIWLRRGQRVRENEPDVEVSATSTLHLFLDGLDEISPDLQAEYARQIVRLADAFPQHSFTVASRQIESTSRFPRDTWRWLKLVPGAQWQTQFLKRHDVNLDEIVNALEGGQALVDLLRLPFFLSRVVQLHHDDALAGKDLWSVVQNLVSDALTREGDRLPVEPDVARDWLRRVALSMQLSNRTELGFDELDVVPIALVSKDQGEVICEALVQRAMLQKSDAGYTFAHRIVAESLVAEALIEQNPDARVLDAIAPAPDLNLRGIRPEWRVIMSLLLPRSQEWLEAIETRDPLQWARSVPDTSPLPERERAAELLWNTYLNWKIWIWNYSLPDVIQDGPALARHIRAGGLHKLEAKIRSDIDDESAQVQSNALRVLGEANVANMEPQLKRVLEDDERYGVVRRQAALVAADLGFQDLLELILARAVNPTDSAEAQDCAAAAIRLANDANIEHVISRLLGSRDSRSIAFSRLSRVLDSSQTLRVLREYARHDPDPSRLEKETVTSALDRAEELSSEDVRNALFICVTWGAGGSALARVVEADRDSALIGAKEALQALGEVWWWNSRLALSFFSADELSEAGVSEEVVGRRRLEEDAERMSGGAGAELAARLETIEPPSTERRSRLSELLSLPARNADESIQFAAHELSDDVSSLTVEERADLESRLVDWWPEGSHFYAAFTDVEKGIDSKYLVDNWANAWMWYGPAIDMDLESEQWAEIALSGRLYETQQQWLRDHAPVNPEGALMSVAIAIKPTFHMWAGALQSIEVPLSDGFGEVIVQSAGEIDAGSYEASYMARRFADDGSEKALELLGKISREARDLVRPYLASLGNSEAMYQELEDLSLKLVKGNRPSRESLFWLDGPMESSYLPSLFNCLALVYANKPAVPRPWDDTATPILNAIQTIGGREAIAHFDDLLSEASDPDVLFLRERREAIAGAELSRLGTERARVAAYLLGVPDLDAWQQLSRVLMNDRGTPRNLDQGGIPESFRIILDELTTFSAEIEVEEAAATEGWLEAEAVAEPEPPKPEVQSNPKFVRQADFTQRMYGRGSKSSDRSRSESGESVRLPSEDRGFCLWLTGLSGAGKSTISELVYAELIARGSRLEILDGDIVRENLSKGLGFSKEDRDTNVRRIAFVADLLSRNGTPVITAAISPYREIRREAREMMGDRFIEVFVDASVDACAERDVKGLYAKAFSGELKEFTGVSDPYEIPEHPEIWLKTEDQDPAESAATIISYLEDHALIPDLRDLRVTNP